MEFEIIEQPLDHERRVAKHGARRKRDLQPLFFREDRLFSEDRAVTIPEQEDG